MKPPCEVIVKYILPAIRALLVKDLTERHKLNQVDIAKRLGITQPAVSQYRRQLRGTSYSTLFKRREIADGLKKLSDAIASGKASHSKIIEMYCKICKRMKRKEVLCIIHAESAPYLKEEECRACLG